MVNEYQIRVMPQVASAEQNIAEYIAQEKGFDVRTINAVRVLKRSIDARQRQVYVNLTVRVYINEVPQDKGFQPTEYPDVSHGKQVIVVGEGPAGLFASLRLIEHGLRPIVIERGKDVRERKKDLAKIKSEQKVDVESNYCFGEGGAGAYSDGKLYTRSKKRGNIEKILNVFCQFGASTNILADAHPHIGTDKLPRVIENMREQIIQSGGEVHFQTKMTELIIKEGEVKGVVCRNLVTESDETYYGPVILATGHSARDVYRYLAHAGIDIEAKGIAVGVRLEHPSQLIDQIQYHNRQGRGRYLPAAEYSFVTQVDGRGVYSFCMCPGGQVVAAASEAGRLVTNGMSNYRRDSGVANAALLVQVTPEDFGPGVLAGVAFQRDYEARAFAAGGGDYFAPVQSVGDFLAGRAGSSDFLVPPSYAPGVRTARLADCLPPAVCATLAHALPQFDRRIPGFAAPDVPMTGIETRSSAPVRIRRDRQTFLAERTPGIYPIGEGAGYAGGIMSAAVDGMKAALAYLEV